MTWPSPASRRTSPTFRRRSAGPAHLLPRWQERRTELAAEYDAALAGLPGLGLPARPGGGRHAWHLYQVRVTSACGISRDAVIDALTSRGIGTSVHFIPVHQLSAYGRILGPEECRSVPVTDQVAKRCCPCPCTPALADADVDPGRRGAA